MRATHAKTIELTAEDTITERATCVIAVATRPPHGAAAQLGPITVTLIAGAHCVTVRADGNPYWRPGGTAILRRSGVRRADTIGTDADHAADSLPRAFVAEAQRAGTPVVAEITRAERRADGRGEVVVAWADPERTDRGWTRLGAELAAADVIVAEDAAAARLVSAAGRVTGDVADVEAALAEGHRALVLAAAELPGATLRPGLLDPARAVLDTYGLPGPLAAAALSPSAAPVVLAGPQRGLRELRRLLRTSAPDTRLAVSLPAELLPRALELAAETRGNAAAVVETAEHRPVRVVQDAAHRGPDLPPGGRGQVYCCFDAAGDEPGGAGTAYSVETIAQALLAEGYAAPAVARVVARLTGLGRQQAYARVRSTRGGAAAR